MKHMKHMKHWKLPTTLTRDSVCYSAGVGEDISLDQQLIIRYGAVVHGFDPTAAAAVHVAAEKDRWNPVDFQRYHFHKYGLWATDGSIDFCVSKTSAASTTAIPVLAGAHRIVRLPCRRLKSVMSELEHEHLDLLKLDIEGSEFVVLESLIADNLRIDTLLVEFHGTKARHYKTSTGPQFAARIRDILDKLALFGYTLTRWESSRGRRPAYATLALLR